MVPDAQVGDWVLVHAGFAITVLDEAAARETWQYLEEAGLASNSPVDTSENPAEADGHHREEN
jgi:hydrogenase assembly chaperone HypC/HupF